MPVRVKRVTWLTVLISANVALFCLSALAVWKIYSFEPPRQTLLDTVLNRTTAPQLIDYKDFISIMLAGLSAMITVLGIGLATIAIWGFSQIKEEARQAAERVARDETLRMSVKMNAERQSAAEARAELLKTPGVSDRAVQNLVDALTASDGSQRPE